MIRILLVDDSHAVRELLAQRLAERGYQVTTAKDGMMAAEMALATPPDIVLTDLWMPGISGVQLCQLLKAEPRTSHVPVVLITNESHRRSRFWARSAGAAAYVTKNDTEALFQTLAEVAAAHPAQPTDSIRPASRIPIHHRLFQRLDAALFESTVAGEVRALAHAEGDAESVFRGLAGLASDVASYRWLGLHVASSRRLFVHAHPEHRKVCEAEARTALSVPACDEALVVLDDRAVEGRSSAQVVADVRGGGSLMGTIAMGPSPRGASREDRELVSIMARELVGPLRIVSLVEQSRRLAMCDPLTGLLNRRAFLESMKRWLAHFDRYGQAVSLLLLDVDHFKQVNDTYGHEAGDMVLRAIAGVLPTVTRQSDVVARWGGEEFVIGLPHTGPSGARIAGERVRRAIEDLQLVLPGGATLTVTASVGVACPAAGESVDALVSRADAAMYVAKSRGRNRVEAESADALVDSESAPILDRQDIVHH